MSTSTQPRERPILFSGPMVRAILDGRKTQTRRVIKPQPTHSDYGRVGAGPLFAPPDVEDPDSPDLRHAIRCPYGQPGDRLWVRETWNTWGTPERQFYDYAATCPDADALRWKPSIHMPRQACRLTLEIVSIRVERLQAIREQDAQAEGINTSVTDPWPREPLNAKNYVYATDAFRDLWDLFNAKRGYGWDANPWVWVVEFRPVPQPHHPQR